MTYSCWFLVYNAIASRQRGHDNRTPSRDLHDAKWALRRRYSVRDANSIHRHVRRSVLLARDSIIRDTVGLEGRHAEFDGRRAQAVVNKYGVGGETVTTGLSPMTVVTYTYSIAPRTRSHDGVYCPSSHGERAVRLRCMSERCKMVFRVERLFRPIRAYVSAAARFTARTMIARCHRVSVCFVCHSLLQKNKLILIIDITQTFCNLLSVPRCRQN